MIDKDQWREFGQDTGVTPLHFTRSAMGFLMTTEHQDFSLTSHPKGKLVHRVHIWKASRLIYKHRKRVDLQTLGIRRVQRFVATWLGGLNLEVHQWGVKLVPAVCSSTQGRGGWERGVFVRA